MFVNSSLCKSTHRKYDMSRTSKEDEHGVHIRTGRPDDGLQRSNFSLHLRSLPSIYIIKH
jgi:hypothetical protein